MKLTSPQMLDFFTEVKIAYRNRKSKDITLGAIVYVYGKELYPEVKWDSSLLSLCFQETHLINMLSTVCDSNALITLEKMRTTRN